MGQNLAMTPPRDRLPAYRRWFYAAAVYNALWGAFASLRPDLFLGLAGFTGSGGRVLFQTIGMIVGVYAYGYWLLAREPRRYAGLVWLGLAGKTLGPIGFLVSALRGEIGWAFGGTILFNDLLWWPAFWGFGLRYARRPLEEEAEADRAGFRPL